MSESFWIGPLDKEAKARLRQVKAKVPKGVISTRAPTPAEFKTVIESLPGFKVEYLPEKPKIGESWQITLKSQKKPKTGPFVLISCSKFPGENQPLSIVYVEAGTLEVVVPIAIGLAKICGTLVLDGEDLYGPHLVEANSKVEALIEAMNAFAEEEIDGSWEGDLRGE